eukprot:TRINITY_DN1829_c1_g2_i3.p1 TRINITY_DN1829_c1_g2~~TRINITY_DN1829_c1_g2_i3.p1  ORF type:complete len:161 (-),score=26.18 TRINITY_DN1829_c1_g2_i3:175-657(-)
MAQLRAGETDGLLIGLIGDEDTVTGFLLSGIGHTDQKNKKNFFVVDNSEYSLCGLTPSPSAILPSRSHIDSTHLQPLPPLFFVALETTTSQIETAFKELTSRKDVALVLINQQVANEIRWLLDEYRKAIPAVLEIPSKAHPYDPTKDSIMLRVQQLLGNR